MSYWRGWIGCVEGIYEKVAPELSEQETKWFEELKRMKAEVLGQGKYDEQSLRARTKLVSTI
jgi:nucleoporin NUP82